MNLAGTIYVSKRATRSFLTMPRYSRPVWRHTNKSNRRGEQEETI
jgi:hypothetical protein